MAIDPIEDRKRASAWRDKILVFFRREARANVYRTAFGRHHGYAYGFLLGNKDNFDAPAIDFSLVTATASTSNEMWVTLDQLRLQFKAAKLTAKFAGVNVIGLFIAQDNMFGGRHHQLMGRWIELTIDLRLQYTVEFPTLGHETLWMHQCYHAGSFPHDPLAYRTVRGKLSIRPWHNPRRVRAWWRKYLADALSSSSGVVK